MAECREVELLTLLAGMVAFAAPFDPHRPALAPVVDALAAVYAAHPDCKLTTRALTGPWVSRARASDVLPPELYNEALFWLVYAVHRADGALAKCEGTLPVDPPRAAGCAAAKGNLERELAAAQILRGWGARDAAAALVTATGRWTEGSCAEAERTESVERCNCGGVDVPSIWPEGVCEPTFTCPRGCASVEGPSPQPDPDRWWLKLGRSWRATGTGRAPPSGRVRVARALSRCPEAAEQGVVFELLGDWVRVPPWPRDLSPWPLGDALPSPSACAMAALARWAEPGAWVRLSSSAP